MPGTDFKDKDLKLKFDRLGADLMATGGDLVTVSSEENLAQAIINRLTTDEGELEDIGHADYGSRLYQVVGEPNNEGTRAKIKNVVGYCLSQEPRIKEVTGIDIRTNPRDQNRLDIEITVVPVEGGRSLSLSYPFHLEVD